MKNKIHLSNREAMIKNNLIISYIHVNFGCFLWFVKISMLHIPYFYEFYRGYALQKNARALKQRKTYFNTLNEREVI